MSVITKSIDSIIICKKRHLTVYCPDAYRNEALPVLYFLHGRTGNENLREAGIWLYILLFMVD